MFTDFKKIFDYQKHTPSDTDDYFQLSMKDASYFAIQDELF